ncbi:hypothetical protein [Chryseobacterium polytrichastri]|uniref:Uncharacterized protein n=1 Tax=Chryseobacterium polytrichastri TaxID=1302687 RepID=A0A1M6U7C8_9FLAO|nr:hypothetical protein [Chryseobacterium polytrichastri]SHK65070.1 hypothetical protein SAMN05444267_100669 [Chryseobacterium polytrichastri]
MKKKFWFTLLLFNISRCIYAQVGINNQTPNSTLAVNGSFSAKFSEITTANYTLTDQDFHVSYTGTSNATFTLPTIGTDVSSYSGRFYKIKNLSNYTITITASDGNSMRINGDSPVATYTIPSGGYIEATNNNNATGGTWDLSYLGSTSLKSNTEIYATQLRIPPHGNNSSTPDWNNHSNSNFDTGTPNDRWWIISKSSFPYEYQVTGNIYHRSSKMTLVYEFQGTPFDTNNLYSNLTPGNNSGFPDVFSANLIKLANDGTNGRTRLTVTVARIDQVGNSGGNSSNWGGSFLLNVLLARTTTQ